MQLKSPILKLVWGEEMGMNTRVNLHRSEAVLIYKWPEDIIYIIYIMCSVRVRGNCRGTAKVFQLEYNSKI